jgi:hypothetical protein
MSRGEIFVSSGTTVQARKASKRLIDRRSAEPASESTNEPNVATGPVAFRRIVLDDTQDLVVSDHGRMGRYHVLRTQRGIETKFLFPRFRFRPVLHPASGV